MSLSADYISRPGTTRHLDPEDSAPHLIFSVVDVALSDGLQIGVGAGHCVTSNEPWVFRSVLGFRFGS